MKVILRCALALIAMFGAVVLVTGKNNLNAQQCCTNNYCSEPPPNCPSPECDHLGGCSYAWVCDSPVVVDVENKGFHLTDQAHGVFFRFFGDQKQHVAWTDPQYGNAWLALDRNGNGTIDDASELFGNDTPQPKSSSPNGFAALAVFDQPENGGNGDGFIGPADKIYSHLLLWTDRNQNGISEPDELQTLAEAGITTISLDYHRDELKDQYGNLFRYRSRDTVNTADYDNRIYDVFLIGTN
jgi:hypothetical protein